MAKVCPDCRSVNDDRVARCGSCGRQLSDENRKRPWEATIGLYLVIALLIGLILAAVWWYLSNRG
jgi:predicted nucleic acid-binding Zn ribbon protein